MGSVGEIFTNPTTQRQYECIAVIKTTPTFTNRNGTQYKLWNDITYKNMGSGEVPNTIVLEDENGNRVVAVLVDGEVDFTATADDIREGKIAATDDGVTVGEKYIPGYIASQGFSIVMPGQPFSVKLPVNDIYDYTNFQAAVCVFNTTLADSVECDRVVINDNLYNVLSTVSVSELCINHDEKSIDLGIINDTDSRYIIRSFTIKEV